MRVYVESFGCAENQAEGEIIKGLIRKNYDLVESKNIADAIVLNVCTVKGTTSTLRAVKKFYSPGKKLIIAGCITSDLVQSIKKIVPNASFVSTNQLLQIATAIENKQIEYLNCEAVPVPLGLPRVRKNKIIGIVPIERGCNSFCAYCSVKLIKGNTKSYSVEAICNEIKNALTDGCKEIWLTGQDTACWGYDIGKRLPELLENIFEIKANFKIRLGMGNPKWILFYLDELIECYKNEKLFKFIHLPIESGSNKVLKAMHRGYKIEDIEEAIFKIKNAIPNITISTDAIVGFPGEDEEDFQLTINAIEKIKPDIVNISRFVPRPGTVAYKMPNQVSSNVKKHRSAYLTSIVREISFENNTKWIGWTGKVLIDEIGQNCFIGRNFAYKPTVLKNSNLNLGDEALVKICDARPNFLIGKVLN